MEHFASQKGFEYPLGPILQSIQEILGKKIIDPTYVSEQSEQRLIVEHWADFDEELKSLILSAIPEVSKHILRVKIRGILSAN